MSRTPPSDGELFYADLSVRELRALARCGDERALQDIERLALEIRPRKRGRPARETELRRELQNILLWYWNERDDESFDALVAICEQTSRDRVIDPQVVARAFSKLEDNWSRDIAWLAGQFASAEDLNLFDDAERNSSPAIAATRFRKAQGPLDIREEAEACVDEQLESADPADRDGDDPSSGKK